MTKVPTLRLTNVTRGVTYQGADILMNADYGGAHFLFGGIGRIGRWSLVMDNHDGQLNDSLMNNGTVMANRDEVKIYIYSPSDSASAGCQLWMHGYITKSKRKIQQNNDRVVYLSGMAFADFWGPDRLFEKNYRLYPKPCSTVIKDILAKWHPNLNTDLSGISEISTAINKEFIAATCVDSLIECCQAANSDVYISPADRVELFAANSRTLLKGGSAKTFTENDTLDNGELYFDSESSHYDEIKFRSNNPMYAPSANTPSGVSFADKLNCWTLRDPDSRGSLYFDPLYTDPYIVSISSSDVIKDNNGVVESGLFAGVYKNIAFGSGRITNAKMELTLTAPVIWQVGSNPNLQLIEVDWDSLNFILQPNLGNITSFKIRLHGGFNLTQSDYWQSKELKDDIRQGQVNLLNILLPDNLDVDPTFWTKTGNPTLIQEVAFIFRGGGPHSNLSFISSVYFQGEVKATATKTSPPLTKRQKLIIERTIQDPEDATNIANAELTRLQSPALLGYINVEGSVDYCKPAYSAMFDYPNDGVYSKTARCDMFEHAIVENEWSCNVYVAPLLVRNSLYNRLAQIALRRNESGETDYNAIDSAVQNRA